MAPTQQSRRPPTMIARHSVAHCLQERPNVVADLLASIVRRTGIFLVLTACSGCTIALPLATPSAPVLPLSASASDVGVDDDVGAARTRGPAAV